MGNKRKYLIYIVFALSVLYGIWFHFIREEKGAGPEPKAGSPAIAQNICMAENDDNITDDPIPRWAGINLPSLPDKWGKDPFLVHNTGGTANNNYTGLNTNEPRLTGISYHQNTPSFAIINNKVLQVNDKVDGWKITSIYDNYVLIKKSGKTKKLMMGETS
jgi:hypothetical protein